ncbi:hypothetical protein BLNAU_5668 [Blattamonas nauphoetae]|uniref:Uncharacterized protein n=1 Tax=Blattamonas nauphoetae TaxID=2049346 RepID=A0ABQ9Y6M9_9EUKA|nr:hypothetical protein BLNAU_5668 [Blattamonas nauphoetae]
MNDFRPGTAVSGVTFSPQISNQPVIRSSTNDSRMFIASRGASQQRYNIQQAVSFKPMPKLYKPSMRVRKSYVPNYFLNQFSPVADHSPNNFSSPIEDNTVVQPQTPNEPGTPNDTHTELANSDEDEIATLEENVFAKHGDLAESPIVSRSGPQFCSPTHRTSVIAAAARYSQRNLFRDLPRHSIDAGIDVEAASKWLDVTRFNSIVAQEEENEAEQSLLAASTFPASRQGRSQSRQTFVPSSPTYDPFPIPTHRLATTRTNGTTSHTRRSLDAARSVTSLHKTGAHVLPPFSPSTFSRTADRHSLTSQFGGTAPLRMSHTGAGLHHMPSHPEERDIDYHWQRNKSKRLSETRMSAELDKTGWSWASHNKRLAETHLWKTEGRMQGSAQHRLRTRNSKTSQSSVESKDGENEQQLARAELRRNRRNAKPSEIERPHVPQPYRTPHSTLSELSTEEGGTGSPASQIPFLIAEKKGSMRKTTSSSLNSPLLQSIRPQRRKDILNPSSVLFHPPEVDKMVSSSGVVIRSPLFNRTAHADPHSKHYLSSSHTLSDNTRAQLIDSVLDIRRQDDDEDSISEESLWSVSSGKHSEKHDDLS